MGDLEGGKVKKIIAVTLGGSSQPIIRSILQHKPDKVLFFVTTSPNGGSKKALLEKVDGEKSIITQTGLKDSDYEVHEIQSPDDLTSSYNEIKEAMVNSTPSITESDRIADYTGGTKTMAVSLAIAALDLNWKLSLVRGERTDLGKTVDGTEVVQLVSTTQFLLQRTVERAIELFDLAQYEAAESILGSLISEISIEEDQMSRVQRLLTLSRGFAAWDRFEHEKALDLLEPRAAQIPLHVRCLKQLLGKSKGSGYEKVWDLLRNAERRAKQGRFDDAVMRLYRALEMFAQIRLRRTYELDTDDIQLEKLSETARQRFDWQLAQERQPITAGFYEAYHLLDDMSDPIGPIFKAWKDKIKNLLTKRNRSILAHGVVPVGNDIWIEANDLARSFLEEIASAEDIRTDWPQFPTSQDIKEQS